MLELLYMDDDILMRNYNKYKDKSGRKAKNLLMQIESSKAFNSIVNKYLNEVIDPEGN